MKSQQKIDELAYLPGYEKIIQQARKFILAKEMKEFSANRDKVFLDAPGNCVIKRVASQQGGTRREMKIAKQLIGNPSPYVVKIFATFEEGPYGYIVMKRYRKNLKQYLAEKKLDISFPNFTHLGHGLYIFLCILFGLTSLKEIAHRDIKPENILVDDTGDVLEVVLADFGIASSDAPVYRTKIGTNLYMAPEVSNSGIRHHSSISYSTNKTNMSRGQLAHNGFYSRNVDCWALGTLLFQIFCGYNTLKFSNKQKVMVDLPFPFNETMGVESENKYYQQDIYRVCGPILPASLPSYIKTIIRSLLQPDPKIRKTLSFVYETLLSSEKNFDEIKTLVWEWSPAISKEAIGLAIFQNYKEEKMTQYRIELHQEKITMIQQMMEIFFAKEIKVLGEKERQEYLLLFIYFGYDRLKRALEEVEKTFDENSYDYLSIGEDQVRQLQLSHIKLETRLKYLYLQEQLNELKGNIKFLQEVYESEQVIERCPQVRLVYSKYVLGLVRPNLS